MYFMGKNDMDSGGLQDQFLVLQEGRRLPASISGAIIQLGNNMIRQHVIRVREQLLQILEIIAL
jgi:hypothetical protein